MRSSTIWLLLAACGGDDGASLVDAREVDAPPGDLGEDIAEIPAGCLTERSTVDRPDDNGYDQIRVVYVTPSDGQDFGSDTNDKICNSVRAFATWFHAKSPSSYLRFDTKDHLVDIGFVRLAQTDEQMRGNDPGNATIETGIAFVRERIERQLQIAPNKLYAVYYEGTSSWACGGGAYPPLIIGRVGAVYLRAQPPGTVTPCGDSYPWGQPSLVPSYIDYAVLHEAVHSMGIVPDSSPRISTTGHVYDLGAPEPERDLMYSPRQGMPDPPWGVLDPAGLILDINNDDYVTPSTPQNLATSSLLAPLAPNAHRPIGW